MNQWIGHPTKNHVRVLLCTLPDVLWQGAKWDRIGMDKLVETDEVRKAYKKYIVKLHPDKVKGGEDPERDYLSNAVFAAITEAWEKFKAQENIK
jgi:cyclin G-associated kinase